MYRLISLAIIIVWIAMFVPNRSYARDDGRFTNSPLKEWFDRLASRPLTPDKFEYGKSVIVSDHRLAIDQERVGRQRRGHRRHERKS